MIVGAVSTPLDFASGVINEEGKVYTVMGAMTMGASNEAVEWLLKMMVEMCPEVADICIGTMSDLGKSTMVYVLIMCYS